MNLDELKRKIPIIGPLHTRIDSLKNVTGQQDSTIGQQQSEIDSLMKVIEEYKNFPFHQFRPPPGYIINPPKEEESWMDWMIKGYDKIPSPLNPLGPLIPLIKELTGGTLPTDSKSAQTRTENIPINNLVEAKDKWSEYQSNPFNYPNQGDNIVIPELIEAITGGR